VHPESQTGKTSLYAMLNFKDYLQRIAESSEVPGRQVSDKELVALLGKGRTNSLLSNPYFKDYSSYQKAYKYGVDSVRVSMGRSLFLFRSPS